jgi:hypothetical protein
VTLVALDLVLRLVHEGPPRKNVCLDSANHRSTVDPISAMSVFFHVQTIGQAHEVFGEVVSQSIFGYSELVSKQARKDLCSVLFDLVDFLCREMSPALASLNMSE